MSYVFNAWNINIPSCGPIKYSATDSTGGPLPSFVTINSNTRTIEVQTSKLEFYGTHSIKISGITTYYSSNSVTESLLKIEVKCEPKSISRVSPEQLWQFTLGSATSKTFSFGNVKINPDCPSIDNTYSVLTTVTVNSGGPLPSFISFMPQSRDFIVQPTG